MDAVNPTDTTTPFRAEIEAMRAKAARVPLLTALCDSLPEYELGKAHAPGLYVDRTPAAGIRLAREFRVSVARVMSVTDEGELMVGQVQVTVHKVAGKRRWRVRWYVHAPQLFYTASYDNEQQWWLQVLERHIARGGEAPETVGQIEA